MHSEQSAPLLDDIRRALGDKVGNVVTAEALGEELHRYLDYGVPPDQARNAILRHYGVSPTGAPTAGDRQPLSELKPSQSYVVLHVRVVSINDKEVTIKGDKRRIQYGIFGDETMTRPFTAWKPIEAKKGDVVKITGAYTKEYQGGAEIHLGDRALVEAADPESIPKTVAPRAIKVGELAAGMSNVEVTARILSVAPRSVLVQGTPKTVWSGLLADDSGKAGFTSWHDFHLIGGHAVRIRGGYVRSFRAQPQFTFDEKSQVEMLADDAAPTVTELDRAGPTPLSELYTGQGMPDVTVEATLIDVRPGSGLVDRCTQCKRVVTDGACRLHGKVDSRPDLRIKAVLDDGTGALSAILNRELTEALLGKTLEECQKMAKDALSAEVVEREIKAKLLSRPLRCRGNVLVDEFGPSMIVTEAALVQRDLAAAAEALLAELEEAVQ